MSNLTPGPDHAAPEPESTVSPKVVAQAATGIALAVILAVITAVTPDMLSSLGSWGVLLYAGIVALGGALAGYVKRDPLRK
jgi:drug/metabolite transporter (DMT)-like permease